MTQNMIITFFSYIM